MLFWNSNRNQKAEVISPRNAVALDTIAGMGRDGEALPAWLKRRIPSDEMTPTLALGSSTRFSPNMPVKARMPPQGHSMTVDCPQAGAASGRRARSLTFALGWRSKFESDRQGTRQPPCGANPRRISAPDRKSGRHRPSDRHRPQRNVSICSRLTSRIGHFGSLSETFGISFHGSSLVPRSLSAHLCLVCSASFAFRLAACV